MSATSTGPVEQHVIKSIYSRFSATCGGVLTYALFASALTEASGKAGMSSGDAIRKLALLSEMSKLPTLEDLLLGGMSTTEASQSASPQQRLTGSGVASGNCGMAPYPPMRQSLSGVSPRLSRAGGSAEPLMHQVRSAVAPFQHYRAATGDRRLL